MSAKRERIIEAAFKLFCENGFHSTSTAIISKEAGVATGTLFLYFRSKDELINALYREAKQEMAAVLQANIPAGAPFEQQLRHFWNRAISWALENKFAFRFLMMYSNSPFISCLTREEAASTFQFTKCLIEKAIKEDRITALDSNLFLSLFSAQLSATISYLARQPDLLNQQPVIDQTFGAFWKGVRKEQ